MRGILAGIVAAGAGCVLADTAVAQGGGTTRINVSYTVGHDRIRPMPRDGIRVQHNHTIVLHGRNRVSESRSASATGMRRNFHRSGSSELVLGQETSRGGWRVLGPSRLQRVFNHPQSTTTLTVSISGRSCSLSVVMRLKPGMTEYVYPMLVRPGAYGYFRNSRAIDPRCTIE